MGVRGYEYGVGGLIQGVTANEAEGEPNANRDRQA